MPLIHNPSNPYIIHYFNFPKTQRHIYSLYTFYYTIQNGLYYPIATSKPNSTQPPIYYQLHSHAPHNTLQSLLDHYTR